MRKFTIFAFTGLFLISLVFATTVAAITAEEINILVAGYSANYFANANSGIKDSFIRSLESISSNIDLYNSETDPTFKTELNQEIRKGIEELISKTNGCVEGNNYPDTDDWLIDCDAQNEIYFKLNELLADY